MNKVLILIAIVLIPFIIRLDLTPIIPPTPEGTRPPKELLGLMFALAITLATLYKDGFKRFNNKWLLLFLLYIPFQIQHSPPFILLFGDINCAGMWQYKPALYIFIYALTIISVASINFSRRDVENILRCIKWCGLIMSIYVLIQLIKSDQFFLIKPVELIGTVTRPEIMGTLGNSTIVSAFIAMCVPAALYFKKYIKAIIMVVAVLVSQSAVSTIAMAVCIILYFSLTYPKVTKYGFSILVISFLALVMLCIKNPKFVRSEASARLSVWELMIEDFREPPIKQEDDASLAPDIRKYINENKQRTYEMTGMGLGSFGPVFRSKHLEHLNAYNPELGLTFFKWQQAHSDWLQLGWCVGIIGLLLFIMALYALFRSILPLTDPLTISVATSLSVVFMCCCATFLLQLEPFRLYSVVLLGLLHNNILQRRVR